jgi:hypothetical protein
VEQEFQTLYVLVQLQQLSMAVGVKVFVLMLLLDSGLQLLLVVQERLVQMKMPGLYIEPIIMILLLRTMNLPVFLD